jgi:ABC-type branched-subunit amino acid transport system ATPase component
MQPIIETTGLTRRFGELTAVDHLDFSVVQGEIFGLVGPDGAGKTTTLRMLCGLLDPTEGSARVAGFDVARESQSVKDQHRLHGAALRAVPATSPFRRTWISTPTCSASWARSASAERGPAAHDAHGAVPQRQAGRSPAA